MAKQTIYFDIRFWTEIEKAEETKKFFEALYAFSTKSGYGVISMQTLGQYAPQPQPQYEPEPEQGESQG